MVVKMCEIRPKRWGRHGFMVVRVILVVIVVVVFVVVA